MGPTSDTANYVVACHMAHTATGARGKMPTDTTLVTLSKPLSVSCGATCAALVYLRLLRMLR